MDSRRMGPAGLRRHRVLWPPLPMPGRHHRGVARSQGAARRAGVVRQLQPTQLGARVPLGSMPASRELGSARGQAGRKQEPHTRGPQLPTHHGSCTLLTVLPSH